MLAFLGRRDSHVFGYYAKRGLRLDPADYQVGAGTGAWVAADIADALLEISGDGVHAAVGLTDVDGRRIEVRIDGCDGHRRRPRRTAGIGECRDREPRFPVPGVAARVRPGPHGRAPTSAARR